MQGLDPKLTFYVRFQHPLASVLHLLSCLVKWTSFILPFLLRLLNIPPVRWNQYLCYMNLKLISL